MKAKSAMGSAVWPERRGKQQKKGWKMIQYRSISSIGGFAALASAYDGRWYGDEMCESEIVFFHPFVVSLCDASPLTVMGHRFRVWVWGVYLLLFFVFVSICLAISFPPASCNIWFGVWFCFLPHLGPCCSFWCWVLLFTLANVCLVFHSAPGSACRAAERFWSAIHFNELFKRPGVDRLSAVWEVCFCRRVRNHFSCCVWISHTCRTAPALKAWITQPNAFELL